MYNCTCTTNCVCMEPLCVCICVYCFVYISGPTRSMAGITQCMYGIPFVCILLCIAHLRTRSMAQTGSVCVCINAYLIWPLTMYMAATASVFIESTVSLYTQYTHVPNMYGLNRQCVYEIHPRSISFLLSSFPCLPIDFIGVQAKPAPKLMNHKFLRFFKPPSRALIIWSVKNLAKTSQGTLN